MDWTLAEIRAKVRTLTGEPSTNQITDDEVDININDYYQNKFPAECMPEELKSWFTQATSPTDSGEYSISSDVVLLKDPATVNGERVKLYQDPIRFKALYPKDTGTAYAITDPTLVIGSSSKAAVANSAFSYRIQNYSYSKAAAETALSGDTVPQNKYGAWRLEIDTDGTVSIVEAGDNATGYDTAAKAVEGIANESNANACMGYVTAMSTASGGFVPGTTLLSAAEVTDTYTDHFHSTRDRVANLLYSGGVLYAGPKADDIYQIKIRSVAKPTALSGSTSVTIPEWGPVVAWGTAIERALEMKDIGRVSDLIGAYETYKTLLNRKYIRQKSTNQRASPTF